jgi:hypothetical protein
LTMSLFCNMRETGQVEGKWSIETLSKNFNREDGSCLRCSWKPLIHSLKKQGGSLQGWDSSQNNIPPAWATGKIGIFPFLTCIDPEKSCLFLNVIIPLILCQESIWGGRKQLSFLTIPCFLKWQKKCLWNVMFSTFCSHRSLILFHEYQCAPF